MPVVRGVDGGNGLDYSTRLWEIGYHADVAQLVEQLICNQQVGGSSPFVSSMRWGGGASCLTIW